MCFSCQPLRRMLTLLIALALAAMVLMSQARAQAPADWKTVKVPEVWKNPPAGLEGLSWYRGFVRTPDGWKGKDLELFVEPTDAACEVYFNGKKIGGSGEFPPFFRSGLGGADRFFVPAASVKADGPNIVALRIFNQEGRTGFNLAAPVLFGEKEAIRMQGDWQFRPGDNAAWSKFDDAKTPEGTTLFARLDNAVEVAATLKRIDDAGPQTTAEALKQFVIPDDLAINLAVGEPHVRQPLSLKWDTRGRLWVVQFIQYPDPAGLKMLSRDKFLRSVYDKVPAPPPNHFKGMDKITFHEDTDGDGTYDKHGTFLEGLSLTSSIAFDKDGVWVLQPPYLLFYADRNHDDVPDGDPEVHLEGFGMEDSHSIANNLRWGPDGWLYGSQGSTVTGDVKRPGEKTAVHSLGQCIWRYHPVQRKYEIFAEGGGNSFGVEIDVHGRIFSGHNGGNTRGFHYVQGGYYRKGFEKHGALSNPYAFGFFENMAHHNVPRFTHTFIFYEENTPGNGKIAPSDSPAALPAKYNGNLFGVEPLQSDIVRSEVTPDRSSLKTKDLDRPITTKDTWFRPVDIQVGPDGAIYVADLYEQRIDHASHYQGRIDRERGRVWRLYGKGGKAQQPFNLTKLTTTELIDLLQSSNRWFRQSALMVLGWKKPADALPILFARLKEAKDDSAVSLLWAVYQLDGLKDESAIQLLGHANPFVRLWTVRVLCDEKSVSSLVVDRLKSLAETEKHSEVRSQLACSIRRLPASEALTIAKPMLSHDGDAADIHIPLSLWWAIEAKADSDRDAVVDLFTDAGLWKHTLVRDHLMERLMRRYASAGTRKDLLACARLLSAAPDAASAKLLLEGFEKAFEGRSLAALPEELIAAIAKVGGGSLGLRLRQGDEAALAESLKIVGDDKAAKPDRLKYIQILGEIHPKPAVAVLLGVLKVSKDAELQTAALGALQAFDEARLGEDLVGMLDSLAPEVRPTALNVLVTRKAWARSLLAAVDAGKVAPKSIPSDVVQRILFQRDEQIAALVKKHFGEIKGATTAEMLAQVEKLKQVLAIGTGSPYNGRKLYLNNCGKCHLLFNEGGRIGPDLTTYKRDDVHTMLVNVVNPSAQIREGFENYVVLTNDGRALTGFIADQDARVVVLRGADGQTTVVPRSDIEEMSASPKSLMPEGALKDFTEQQVRDLFAYLRSTQPLATR